MPQASQARGRRFESGPPLSLSDALREERSGFSTEEILAEFGEARGSRGEFFGDGFNFRRLGPVDGLDPRLVKQLSNARWRRANPEAVRAYWRAWRAANPERARAYVNSYAKTAKGRDVAKAKKARWRQRHRDAYNAAQRAAYARRTAKNTTSADVVSERQLTGGNV